MQPLEIVETQLNPGDPLGLCETLEGKALAFRRFLDATVALKGALEAEHAGKIETLLEERDSCIERINAMDGYIRRISGENPSYYARLSAKRRERLRQLSALIEKVLDQMAEINKECLASATLRIRMIQTELSGTICGRQGLRGYARREGAPRFINTTL